MTATSPAGSATEGLARALAGMTDDDLRALTADMTDDEFAVVAGMFDGPGRNLAQTVGRASEAAWRATPTTMGNYLTGGKDIKRWAYANLLGEKFADAVEGRSTRQIWNLPPRYGKSTLASQWGPAWALDRNPGYRMILVSYGDTLALENAGRVRDILEAYPDQLRADLRPDQRARGRFATRQGGGVLAAGLGSTITGFPADGLVFDDPYKNWQEAHSAARRDRVDNEFRATVASRMEQDDSWVIVVQTRWHEEDLCGRLQHRMEDGTGDPWEVIRIPELAETYDPAHHLAAFRAPDPLGRKPGEPIEVNRFSLKAIQAKHRLAGSYLTAALYQQRPAPEEGGELKRAWWRLDTAIPAAWDQAIASWDLKLKDNETGDFVVGQAWGRTGKDMWLYDMLRGQWNQATAECAIALLSVRHPEIRAHLVENAGYGPEAMAALRTPHPGFDVSDDIAGQLGMTVDERIKVTLMRRRGVNGIVPVRPHGSKSARMRNVSGYIEAGDVHLPAGAAWLGIFLDETAAFPRGSHDDMVDAASQGLARLVASGVPATATVPTGTLPAPQINTRGGGTTGITTRPGPGPARVVIPRVTGTGR